MDYYLIWPDVLQKKEDYPPRRRIFIHPNDKDKFEGEDPEKELYKLTIRKNGEEITQIVKPKIRHDLVPDPGKSYFASDNLPRLKDCQRGKRFEIIKIERYAKGKRFFFWIGEFVVTNLIESVIAILLIVKAFPESWEKVLRVDKDWWLFIIACSVIILPRIKVFIKNWKK